MKRCGPKYRHLRGVAALCALAGALALAGCSLAPLYKAPSLPVAMAYPADARMQPNATTEGRIAAETAWHDYFVDPHLRALIARALDNSRDLKTAVLRVAEARAAYGIQRADQLPTIAATANGSRARVPGDLNISGQSIVSSQYQVGAGLATWELDFWGRVRNLKDAALENYLATDDARRAITLSLIAQVADSYLALRELDERIALARQTIASREESLRIFKRRFEVGAIAKMDLVQVEVLLQQAQTLTAQLEQGRDVQAHALALLVGSPLPPLPENTGLSDDVVARELRVGLPSDLLLQRPDIVAAEHQLRAVHANIGAARAAFFPRITLTGSAGTASAGLDGLFDSGSRAWSFMPSLSLPIFDAGRNRANLDLAEVRRDLAVTNYEKTVQTAFRDVSDALSARHWLTEQVRIAQATLAAQTERARLSLLRYDNGSAPYFEVLDAQRDLLTAEQQLVQTRRALLSSRVSLYAALGGGSQEFAAPVDTATRPAN
ncbi:MAG: efflux transporter outer membrane subunit [Georgfuchsia sp.]|nr:efflux transporter outer membrane subunit [Sulfuritalea sp.]MBP8119674.1 efflux transporter outer membrane subunit [Burkholderiales bacterium]